MPKENTPLELRLYAALKRIATYETPERLQRTASKTYGLDGAEAVEMAYENVLAEAKSAIKGVRIRATACAELARGSQT